MRSRMRILNVIVVLCISSSCTLAQEDDCRISISRNSWIPFYTHGEPLELWFWTDNEDFRIDVKLNARSRDTYSFEIGERRKWHTFSVVPEEDSQLRISVPVSELDIVVDNALPNSVWVRCRKPVLWTRCNPTFFNDGSETTVAPVEEITAGESLEEESVTTEFPENAEDSNVEDTDGEGEMVEEVLEEEDLEGLEEGVLEEEVLEEVSEEDVFEEGLEEGIFEEDLEEEILDEDVLDEEFLDEEEEILDEDVLDEEFLDEEEEILGEELMDKDVLGETFAVGDIQEDEIQVAEVLEEEMPMEEVSIEPIEAEEGELKIIDEDETIPEEGEEINARTEESITEEDMSSDAPILEELSITTTTQDYTEHWIHSLDVIDTSLITTTVEPPAEETETFEEEVESELQDVEPTVHWIHHLKVIDPPETPPSPTEETVGSDNEPDVELLDTLGTHSENKAESELENELEFETEENDPETTEMKLNNLEVETEVNSHPNVPPSQRIILKNNTAKYQEGMDPTILFYLVIILSMLLAIGLLVIAALAYFAVDTKKKYTHLLEERDLMQSLICPLNLPMIYYTNVNGRKSNLIAQPYVSLDPGVTKVPHDESNC